MEKLGLLILNLIAIITYFATMLLILVYIFASIASKIKVFTGKKYMILIIGFLFDLTVYYLYYKVLFNELSFKFVTTLSDVFDVTVLLLLYALLIMFFGFHYNQITTIKRGTNEEACC